MDRWSCQREIPNNDCRSLTLRVEFLRSYLLDSESQATEGRDLMNCPMLEV
jgi:hypothetical protein